MQRISKVLLIVLCLAVTVAYAETNIGFNGIGGRLGYVMPEDPIDNSLAFGAVADLGQLSPDIDFEANLIYWSNSEGAWKWSSFQIDAIAKYKIKTDNPDLRPFVGGGLGFHRGAVSWEYTDPWSGKKYEEDNSETDIAIVLVGGAKKQVSDNMDGFAELRYSIAGDFDTFGIYVGVIYNLKK